MDITMDIGKLEKYVIDDLIRGYSEENEHFICLWCGSKHSTEDEVKAHIEKEHPAEKRFEHLLNADSLVGFSMAQNLVLNKLFQGMDAKEVSETLNLPASTIRYYKQDLFQRMLSAKAMLMFCELFFQTNSRRKYDKKNKNDESLELIPAFDENNRIVGVYPKVELHMMPETPPLRHGTVLILPVQKREGKLYLLIGNKASQLAQKKSGEAGMFAWDCIGGHIQVSDIGENNEDVIDLEITNELFEKIAHQAADRELCEELQIGGKAPNVNDLRFLYTADFDGDTLPYGQNHERTSVYVLPIKTEGKAFIKDEWFDTFGQKVVKRYEARISSFEDVRSEFLLNRNHFMDGVARILDAIEKDPSLYDRMLALSEH